MPYVSSHDKRRLEATDRPKRDHCLAQAIELTCQERDLSVDW